VEVSVLPNPLHPAVVHFPLVLMLLLPISSLAALWAIRRGAAARRAWAIPLAVAVALSASSWLALETGQAEEDRVENVVPQSALGRHEEAAERFLLFSGLTSLVVIMGLARGNVGTAARLLGTVGSFALILAGVQVGAAGGELVYRHGAANAYVQASGSPGGVATPSGRHDDDDERQRR
jgi:uncharacterized membrane protein